MILLVGENPIDGVLGAAPRHVRAARTAIAASLGRSTPFIGAALAVAFAFRAGLFNIGVEGQLLVGATAAAWVGTWAWIADLPAVLAVLVVLVAGVVGGGALRRDPGRPEGATGAHEVITTIMLNAIAVLYVRWLVSSQDPVILRDMTASVPRTAHPAGGRAAPGARRTARHRCTSGSSSCWRCASFVWFVLQRTTTGFEIRMVGANPNAARYAGVSVSRIIVW